MPVMAIPDVGACRALILAPHGRDAAVACSLLTEAGVGSLVSADLAVFQEALGDAIGLAVVTDEAIRSADLRSVAAWVGSQPKWSDLPFIILTQRGGGPERNPAASRLSELLGNVTFLERPFHPTTFVSVVRTALKGRLRQYEARARIAELREGEERLRTALLAGNLGSWELDLASGALSCSDTCKAVFGFEGDRVFTLDDLLAGADPSDRTAMREAMQCTVETGCDFKIEHRSLWPKGATRWVEIRARLVRGGTGAESRLIGVASDITARKTSEDYLRRLNETLEERVASRTAELEKAHRLVLEEIKQREKAEEQLRQAQKIETIGQLTGGVAHDFNNLLMAVLGNLDLLSKHIPNDPRATRLIEGALRGAKRGAALTQRLLAFARRQELKIEPVDLIGLVRGMTDLLERSIGASIGMRMILPSDLPPALADANQVEMALLNLVVNARDAMPDGGALLIQLDLAVQVLAEDIAPGKYLRLSIVDTGHGMDGETLRRAIDPFFSTKEPGKGTGLGLSMTHGLAVQLNGALRLSSAPGRGTRAELWLPATTAVTQPKEPAPAAPDQVVLSTQKATILVVDDDALIAMSTVDMLEDLGHDVIEVNSGANAVAILENGRSIDLLITDYSMPGMTGLQLAKAARIMRPDLPILLATGYADLPHGTDLDLPRLGKPYRQDQLAAEIAKALRSRVLDQHRS